MKTRTKIDRRTVASKDVILCETTNQRAGRLLSEILLHEAVSFTRSYRRIPFYQRESFHGADEICVILINRNEYARGRHCISQLEPQYQRRLLINYL